MRRFLGWCALALVLGFGARAVAQTPEEPAGAPTVGDPGHWSISLERLFGFDYAKETVSMGGMDEQTTSATSFSLLSNPVAAVLSSFSFPRAGFDAFVAPGLSLGTALGVFYGSESNTPTGGTSVSESFTGVVVMPRVGYVARLSPSISFWPRAGVSIIYVSVSPSSNAAYAATETQTSHLIAGTLEAPFVFTIAPRVALTFGPTFDMTFSGGRSTTASVSGTGTSSTVDEKVMEIGAQAGLVVTL
jgi:hypothetical protein